MYFTRRFCTDAASYAGINMYIILHYTNGKCLFYFCHTQISSCTIRRDKHMTVYIDMNSWSGTLADPIPIGLLDDMHLGAFFRIYLKEAYAKRYT